MMLRAAGSVAAAGAVAGAAYRAGALSAGGAVAATAVGAAVLGAGGRRGSAVLFAFFLPATALSRLERAKKRAMVDVAKTGPRDARQVLANGGIAAAAILGAGTFATGRAAFAGALAAAAADTWGTELGTLARGRPRSILTLRPMEAGLSGGITWQGTFASAGGAAAVAAVAGITGVAPFWPVFAGGFAGALVDSLLGAGAQALRYCPRCRRDCETDPHACGTATVLRRGARWLENDGVNVAATATGAAVALTAVLLA